MIQLLKNWSCITSSILHEDFNQSKFEFCNAQKFIKKQNKETKNEWNFHHTKHTM